jgi:hypothetical protein
MLKSRPDAGSGSGGPLTLTGDVVGTTDADTLAGTVTTPVTWTGAQTFNADVVANGDTTVGAFAATGNVDLGGGGVTVTFAPGTTITIATTTIVGSGTWNDNQTFGGTVASVGGLLANSLSVRTTSSDLTFATGNSSNHFLFKIFGTSTEVARLKTTGGLSLGTTQDLDQPGVLVPNGRGIWFETGAVGSAIAAGLYNSGVDIHLSTLGTNGVAYITANGSTRFLDGSLNEVARVASGGLSVGSSADPAASALLDLVSTSKGLLPPRMTTTQRNAIASPAEGLIVYDTDLHALYQRQNGAWVALVAGTSGANPFHFRLDPTVASQFGTARGGTNLLSVAANQTDAYGRKFVRVTSATDVAVKVIPLLVGGSPLTLTGRFRIRMVTGVPSSTNIAGICWNLDPSGTANFGVGMSSATAIDSVRNGTGDNFTKFTQRSSDASWQFVPWSVDVWLDIGTTRCTYSYNGSDGLVQGGTQQQRFSALQHATGTQVGLFMSSNVGTWDIYSITIFKDELAW